VRRFRFEKRGLDLRAGEGGRRLDAREC